MSTNNGLAISAMNLRSGPIGNVGSRPRKWITDRIRKQLLAFDDPVARTRCIDRIVKAQIDKASQGDTAAFRELVDRVEGKVSTQDGSDGLKIVVLRELSASQPPALEPAQDAVMVGRDDNEMP